MWVDHTVATQVYQSLPKELQYPTHHPEYVALDAKYTNAAAVPVCYCHQTEEGIFYHVTKRQEGEDLDQESQRGYGGPIIQGGDQFKYAAYQHYLQSVKDIGVLAEFIRFTPLLNNQVDATVEVFADRETVWIDLNELDIFNNSFQTRGRRAVRKAKKNGLHCQWREDEAAWEWFANTYMTRMQTLSASQEYLYPLEYFLALRQLSLSKLLLCYKDDKPLAGVVFLFGGQFIDYHLSASTDEGMQYWATPLIIAEACHYGQDNGYEQLHLGGGTDARDDNSLLYFKAGFSPRRAQFSIGKHIYQQRRYTELQAIWRQQGREPRRVLFYR